MPISRVRWATGVHQHAVNAQRGQQHGDAGEKAQEQDIDARLRHGVAGKLLHGADTEDRQIASRVSATIARSGSISAGALFPLRP